MAIQFQCPSCEAQIRVPDAAAGKKGTCPRCNEKLIVPTVPQANVSRGPGTSVPGPAGNGGASTAPAGLPRLNPLGSPATSPLFHAPTEDLGLGLPKLDPGDSPPVGLEPVYRPKTKPPASAAAWIVPLLCIVAVGGFIAWYINESQPKLEGALVAETVHDVELKPGFIPGTLSGLNAEDLGEVLRHLHAQPARWASSTTRFTLTGTDKGVQVSVRNGPASHFVIVSRSQNPDLTQFVQKHMDTLDQPRLASLEKYAPKLFTEWKHQFTKNEPLSDQKDHRDRVLIPAMVSGFGYHVEAVVNSNIYPCVHENDDGDLYFLLPNATRSFVLRGRKVEGGVPVPAHFTVKISNSAGTSPAKKKSKRQTQEERELENEGMNPDLQKSDADEPNSEKPPMSEVEAIPLNAEAGEEGMDMDNGPQPSATAKSKSTKKKRPTMMMEDEAEMMDGEMMNDEMPAKPATKKKPAMMLPD